MPSKGPSILEIHPGLACPLRCRFCYREGQGYEQNGRPLAGAEFRPLLQQFARNGGSQIIISGGLEPYTRPRLANQLVRESRAHRLRVNVYTNGVPRAHTEQVTLRLLATATTQVRFSVPAATAATYATITNPASSQDDLFESVVSRVRRLSRVRDAIGGRSRIGVSFLMVPENAAELQEAAHLWLRSGIDFFDVRTDAAGSLGHGRPVQIAIQALRRRVELGCFEPMQVSLPEDPPHGRCFAQRCYAPLEKLVVDPWGYVWTCCLLAQPGIRPRWARVGNLRVESFLDVVARVKGMVPFRHCRGCTPFEAGYNRLSEQRHGKDGLALQDKPADQTAHPDAGRPLSCGV